MAGETPSRRRGGLLLPRVLRLRPRNTPASAGRTPRRSSARSVTPEHPRVGGEDAPGADELRIRRGTPPRRRGGRRFRVRVGTDHRNTPASAGRTPASGRSGHVAPEHPRVGGEDVASSVTPPPFPGTPPRRRGGRTHWGRRLRVRRNTPASAGRTQRDSESQENATEHPRVGGEDASVAMTSRSPAEHPRVGGEDEDMDLEDFLNDGTPPRRRGGRLLAVLPEGDDRNTPASAGRTRNGAAPRCTWPEHPRVGGEDAALHWTGSGTGGTPPRRRGGRPQQVFRDQLLRNTPASAGRTLPDLHLKKGFAFSLPSLKG